MTEYIELGKVVGFRSEASGEFYFRGVAGNGETVYPSEGYENKGDRDRAAESLAHAFGVDFQDEDGSA